MTSINAQKVAQDVMKAVRKGQKVVLGKIIEKRYSKSVSKSPTKVTETKSYKDEMRPIVEQLEVERQAIIKRLSHVRNKAKYRDLIDGLDKTTKNIQLLTGGKTENIGIEASEEEKKTMRKALDEM